MIRISLIEPHQLWRSALSIVISQEKDIKVFFEFARVSDAIERAANVQKTDVGVISIDSKSGHNNLAAVSKLKKVAPSCQILALVDETIPGSINSGLSYIQGFVSRNSAKSPSLATYIRRVARKEQVIEPASLAIAAARAPASPITPLEHQILQGLKNAQRIEEIAATLQLAIGTVRNYTSNIYQKTGTRNRIGAVKVAEDRGWL